MARSLIQLRREAQRARVEAYEASLRRVSQQARPAPSFQQAIDEAKCGFESDIVRDPRAWQPQMKTRDAVRLRLAAARYLFARYPVAQHLEQVWTDPAGLEPDEVTLRKRWYIVAAGGGSLLVLENKNLHPIGSNRKLSLFKQLISTGAHPFRVWACLLDSTPARILRLVSTSTVDRTIGAIRRCCACAVPRRKLNSRQGIGTGCRRRFPLFIDSQPTNEEQVTNGSKDTEQRSRSNRTECWN